MICNVPRTKLFQYLDRELPDHERAQIESHVESCVDCHQVVHVEQAFRVAYVERLRPDRAPERVRDQTARLLDSLARHPSRHPATPWGRRARIALAALALVALGVGLGARFKAGEKTATIGTLAEASVEQHQKLTRGLLPFDIVASSPKEAEAWFKHKLDFNVSLPELRNEHLSFLGGRISHLGAVDVAALGYRVDGQNVSLFIIPEEQYRRFGLSETPKFKMVNHRGYDVILWRSHGAGYSLVSETGGKPCLVCHSPEERLELAPAPAAHRS